MENAIDILNGAYEYNQSRILEHKIRIRTITEEFDKLNAEVNQLDATQADIKTALATLHNGKY